MVRHCLPSLLAMVAIGAMSCGPSRYSSSGFRLPPDGNAERGKAAFLALGCHTCHSVVGSDLPRQTVQPPVPVVLGGTVARQPSDGFLVTAIINPSFQMAQSRMPHYADRITVRQLTDIVEFLQAQYHVAAEPQAFPYF
jgi:mono/diheme cytochrome c family protein